MMITTIFDWFDAEDDNDGHGTTSKSTATTTWMTMLQENGNFFSVQTVLIMTMMETMQMQTGWILPSRGDRGVMTLGPNNLECMTLTTTTMVSQMAKTLMMTTTVLDEK